MAIIDLGGYFFMPKNKDKRNQYWLAIRRMRQDYLNDYAGIYDLTIRPALHYYAELKWGIKMGLDGQGNYTQDFKVVDPKKYMLFQIKYMK